VVLACVAYPGNLRAVEVHVAGSSLAAEVYDLVVLIEEGLLLDLAVEVSEAQKPEYQVAALEVDSASVALMVDAAAPASAAPESMLAVAVAADESATLASLEMEAEEVQKALMLAQGISQVLSVLASLPPLRQDSSSCG